MSIFSSKLTNKRKNIAIVGSAFVFAAALTGASVSVSAEESALTDIVAPETGYNAVAHYEFSDAENLGKDSLGNYDLVAQNVETDAVNGGVSLKDGGILYAPALDADNTDFSDLIQGSYSLSMRVYLRSVSDGANYLLSTGSYGSHFQANWAYQGLSMTVGNSQTVKFGTSANDLGGKAMLDEAFSWYRITMIYDESAMTFRLLTTKESDDTYTFDGTATLSSVSTFGGHANTFTIGAQSKFGKSVSQQANTSISDGTTAYGIYPNVSDLRVYSGVIDDTELAEIAKYDSDKLAAKQSGYQGIAHYEFKYPDNLGKDSLGNYDLIATDGVALDQVNGGVTLGGTAGVLYAPALYPNKIGSATDGYVDFSDLIQGSYSLSMRVFMRSVNDGANYLLSTGSYGSNFQANWAYQGLSMSFGDSQTAKFGTSSTDLGNKAMFDTTFSWYRITTIYDESASTFRMVATKESDESYSFDATATLSTPVTFGGHANTFTIGAQSNFGEAIAQHASSVLTDGTTVYPNVSDFRLYSGVIDDAELAEIAKYDSDNLAMNDPENMREKQVRPLVWYEFNDKNALGKDSMGNFDLAVGGKGFIDHDEENGYVTFTKENESFLYAPYLYGNTDWSDLLVNGYTVSYTLKADNTVTEGNRYAITTSSYCAGFCVTGSNSGYRVVYSSGGEQTHAMRYETGSHKNEWVSITISMDKETSKLAFYVNGLLFDEQTVDDYQGFTREDKYAFAIGAQATGAGLNGAQYFEGSISDVKVYDFALSARNVKDAYDNADTDTPFSSVVACDTVEEITVDVSEVNAVVDATNTVESVVTQLPDTVTVKNSNDEENICSVVWLGFEEGKIKGYVKGASFNVEGLFAEVPLYYVVDFSTPSSATFEEVKLNGSEYAGGSIAFGECNELTFKLQVEEGYKISSVAFNNQKIEADETGLYTVSLNSYSKVSVTIAAEEYVITYVLNNGGENEEQIFGYKETVYLADYFTKQGYVFDGWYDNEELTGEKITEIDTENPRNITLYAKWVEAEEPSEGGEDTVIPDDDTGDDSSNNPLPFKWGCSGGVGSSFALLPLCFAAIVLMRKKEDK